MRPSPQRRVDTLEEAGVTEEEEETEEAEGTEVTEEEEETEEELMASNVQSA